jgi:acetoin utilization protein AcuB
MLAKELISGEIQPLKVSDKAVIALHWMDEFRIGLLPVVDGEQYVGLVSEEAIFNLGNFEESLSEIPLTTIGTSVHQHQHIFDAIRNAALLKLCIVPVVDAAGNYLGVITQQAMIDYMARLNAVENPGGIVVLEVAQNNYSLAEIARIAEADEAHVLSANVVTSVDSSLIEVTIKFDRLNIQQLIQSLERHGYRTKASFFAKDSAEDLHDRYDSLMNFLNI